MALLTRRCSLCRESKEIGEFSPGASRCKRCYNAYRRARRAQGRYLYRLPEERMREIRLNWKQRNREKVLAQKRLQDKVRRGVVVRPTVCPRCEREVKVHAHHTDYENDIYEWLCQRCHSREHWGIAT
jgi:hypothetical protein